MIYFKEVEKAIKQVYAKWQTESDLIEKAKAAKQYKALQELLAYIHTGKWISTKDGLERVLDTLKDGIPNTAKKYQTTENSIRVGLSKASRKVKNKIGEEVLPMILQGDTEDALYIMRSNTRSMQDVLLPQIKEYITSQIEATEIESKTYDLKECTPEIKFLYRYSKQRSQQQLKDLDFSKLNYLLQLLDVESTQKIEQRKLYNILNGVSSKEKEE
jgi:hypothetical protein